MKHRGNFVGSGGDPRRLFGKWCRVALILAVGGWVYFPALQGGWLWDDHIDILQNPVMRDPAGWWKIWTAPAGWHFFPLKTTVFWVEWRLWGEHTLGYHVTSVALHLLGALGFWRILARLGLSQAWLGGLWFAVHPLAVESVAWIAELKNTLSLPLLLAAFAAWLDYDERRRWGDYGRALVFFTAAMLAKTSVVMFPVVLLLYALWRHGRIGGRALCALAPFFVVSLVLGLVTVWFEHREALEDLAIAPLAWSGRLAAAGGGVGFYFIKAIFPAGLSPVYPLWPLHPPPTVYFLPWLIVAGLAILCRSNWKTWGRHLGFGLGFFLVNLVPVLGFLPMAYHHISRVADHFVYLPLLGLIGLGLAGAEQAAARLAWRPARPVAAGLAALLVVAWAGQSRRYAAVFNTEETLWRHAVAAQPDAWLAHHDLAFLLARTGRTEEAVLHYRQALRLKPDNAEAWNNLANALLARGQTARALAGYAQAVRLRPRYAEGYGNLGNALAAVGRPVEARAASRRALELDRDNRTAHVTLAELSAAEDRPAEAGLHYAAALRQRPDDATLQHNYGSSLFQLGRLDAARRHYEAALRLQPNYAEARVNLGHVWLELGREPEAVAQWQAVLRRQPEATAPRVALGNLYVRTGRPQEARAEYEAVLRRQPRDAEVRNNLAFALAQLGLFDEAIRECEQALLIRPDYQEARENLVRLRALRR